MTNCKHQNSLSLVLFNNNIKTDIEFRHLEPNNKQTCDKMYQPYTDY